MAKKGVTARQPSAEEELPPATVARRIGWVALAGVWLFIALALATFNSADAPSHVVAVHNEPAANWCGQAGAVIAYWSYQVIGLGSWVLMAGVLGYLIVTVTGRVVSHPLVRALGLIVIALAVSSLHGLLLPNTGPLAGAHAGLIAEFTVSEMVPRFNVVGTFLLLLAAVLIGAIVSMERLVFALPLLIWNGGQRTIEAIRRIPPPRLPELRWMRARPEAALAAPVAGKRGGKRGKGEATGRIDPDAGGVGATDSFDPEEYEEYEEDEYEEEGDEDEYEYVDEEDDEPVKQERKRLSAEELKQKISRLPVRMANTNKKIARDEDIIRQPSYEGYQFPTLELLEDPESNFSEQMEKFVREQAQQLEEALQTYGIDGEVVGIESGPVVTLYSVQLAPGTKVAKINAIASDVARSLRAQNIRIVSNMVGKTAIGIEVPNIKKEKVRLKELMSGGQAKGMGLPMFLGKDASGEPLVADLTRMPHMLIAGTTGSGKSVCINTIIMSWLYTKRPDELKLVLVDPKMVEMAQFSEVPHLMCPVVTESAKAAAILEWAVNKMEERYELLKEAAVRDIASYNALTEEELYELFQPQNDLERAKIPKQLPYMVFVIDELADLMMTNREAEHSIVRIAQKARAVGIHLILATQRPQANVVTGLIKSNMPARVSFKVASGMDSRIVLDHKGAELLLGQGDMLMLTPHTSELTRAQGTLVTDMEIKKVARFIKSIATPTFERSLMTIRPSGEDPAEGLDEAERDPLFDKAVEIMIETGRGSVSLLQRRLAIGYSRASRLVDQMSLAGILGDHKGSVAREVLITLDDWEQMKLMEDEADSEGTIFAKDAAGDEAASGDGETEDPPFVETVRRQPAPAEQDAAPDDETEEFDEEEVEEDEDDAELVDADADEPEVDEEGDEEEDDDAYEYEYVDADDEEEPGEDDDEYEYEYVEVDEDEDEDEGTGKRE
ncbi:MAG: DNA translocase FtsK [Phycisphaerales bacterium]|nr:MAG: DNA translocase FtsK [Phycisphaerales bacterium]